MPQAAIILSSFNGGEWSEDLSGRIDNDYYNSSTSLSENLIPMIQGPLTKRTGFVFVRRTKYNDKKTRIIKFEFSSEQVYHLEVGYQYIRFYKDHGSITESPTTITNITSADPAVVTSASHGYSNGDEVFIQDVVGMNINSRWVKVANVTTNTYEIQDLDGNDIDLSAETYASGGTASKIYEISTPWDEDDIQTLQWTQSADVMFIAVKDKHPKTLTRSSDTNWTLADYEYEDGPYNNINSTSTTITPSATSGSVTLTASTSIFDSNDVGRWVRVKQGSQWGAAKITAYSSGTSVTAETHEIFPFKDTSASAFYRLGLWKQDLYPQAVQFFQSRLFWFTGEQIDGSYTNDYYKFSPTDGDGATSDGTVTDSNAIQRPLGGQGVNYIIWAVDNEKALIVGTLAGEWILRANSLGEAITPTNTNVTRPTDFGSKLNSVAGRVQSNGLFIQKTGRALCQIGYDLQYDGFNTVDMNLFNTAINADGVKEFAYMGHPDNNIFVVHETGTAAFFSYNPTQAVRGWASVSSYKSTFQSVSAGPAPENDRDEVWVVVKRRINGSLIQHVEYMSNFVRQNTLQEDANMLDCSLTYDGRRYPSATIQIETTGSNLYFTADASVFSAGDVGKKIRTKDGLAVITAYSSATQVVSSTVIRDFKLPNDEFPNRKDHFDEGEWWICDEVSTISGLWHLENETVSVVGDGVRLNDALVTNGQLTLSDDSCVVHAGFPYTSKFISQRPNSGAADGTAQGKNKRVDRIVLRLWKSLGGKYAAENSQHLDSIIYRSPEDEMDAGLELYTGDTEILPLPSGYSQDGKIVVQHDEPLPFTLVAIILLLVTQDAR